MTTGEIQTSHVRLWVTKRTWGKPTKAQEEHTNATRSLTPLIQKKTPRLTYLHPVGLPVAGADAGSEGPSGHTADHHGHALLTGPVALLLDLSAQLALGQVRLVTCAVHGETPVVLLATTGQQPERE